MLPRLKVYDFSSIIRVEDLYIHLLIPPIPILQSEKYLRVFFFFPKILPQDQNYLHVNLGVDDVCL